LPKVGLQLVVFGFLLTALMPAASADTKRIFVVPPTQWDNAMSRGQPAHSEGSASLGNLIGGIVFGLSPAEVNAKLSNPSPGVEWANLPSAPEYPDDVRYFWVRSDAIRQPGKTADACTGANSYIVFLFRQRGLFRISWRLLPDNDCASPSGAAASIFARYLAVDGTVALATHYRAGKADVVEITDPTVDYLIPYRWANRQQR
jgi:hypothetical protein